ncbi:hypothetical protein J2T13_001369 [Paenibacillus sp. DS2015]
MSDFQEWSISNKLMNMVIKSHEQNPFYSLVTPDP